MDTPWVKEDWKIYRNRPETPSIPLKRTSGTHRLSPCPTIATRSQMTLWRMTPLCPDIPPGAERDRRERRDNHLAHRRRHRERCHGLNGRRKKLNLPIFRDSSSDNAITYDDWRSEVDNYIREGHSHQLIRDSVLSALEGRPRHTAKAAMVDGDGFAEEHYECPRPDLRWRYHLHYTLEQIEQHPAGVCRACQGLL